jgi:isopenicillin N synthase-like dioxygenase
MNGSNIWPDLPGFKDGVAGYYGECLSLARRLIRLFAEVLYLPESFFDEMFVRPGAMSRVIHYPPQPANDPDTVGIGMHTDYECFTILCQDEQPGLQILNVAGEWIEAPPIPGTFVVNIGDMLARWSNDVFISTVHRVLNSTGKERYSVPLFFGPSYNVMIEPLQTCLADGEKPKYEPILAGDYVWRRLEKSRLNAGAKVY